MTLLQFGIGATNDLVDAPRDAGLKPGKPIPAGLVSPDASRLIVLLTFAGGLALAMVAGPQVAALSVLVMAIGLAYDFVLKGTAWSWVPFAVGIPVLPVYGWFGAAGSLPPLFGILIPVAIAGGAALAIANTLVDVERDTAAGARSVATSLGPARAWAIGAVLVAAIVASAIASAWAVAGPLTAGVVAAAGLVPLGGVALGHRADAARRERAWQVEAIGLGLLAVAWLVVVRV
jgi:4-hydroxybenzoate polyprenyltransferase